MVCATNSKNFRAIITIAMGRSILAELHSNTI